jgi:hypothetical protein
VLAVALRTIELPWYEQPQEVVGVSEDLRASFVWVGSSYWREILGGFQAVATGSPVLRPSSQGLVIGLSAGGNALQVASNPTIVFPDASQCTIAVWRRHLDTTIRQSTLFGYVVGGDRIQMNAPWSDGNVYWDFGNPSNNIGRVSGAWGAKSTAFEAAVFVAGGGKGREIWRAGTRIASNNGFAPRIAITSANINVGSLGGVNADNEEIALIVVSPSAWSDDLIRTWSRAPYTTTFAPRRIFVPYSAAPSGAPTLTALAPEVYPDFLIRPRFNINIPGS